MNPTPLPYIARPEEEARLRQFLLERLQPEPGSPTALALCGRAGVGKRTMIRHVFASDPRFKAYRTGDLATHEMLKPTTSSTTRNAVATGVEAVGHGVGFADPVVGTVYNVLQSLVKLWISGQTAPEPLGEVDYGFLERVKSPTLLVVSGIDPANVTALRGVGSLIREDTIAGLQSHS